jgi:hypothetical protein
MEKLTVSKLEELVKQRAVNCSEDELKAIFEILGLKIKEYSLTLSGFLRFEIHYRREYVLNYREDETNSLASFGNEYLNFDGEGSTGLSMKCTSIKELIQLFFGIASRLRFNYEGNLFDEEESIYTEEEMQALVEKINELIFNKETA